MSLGFLMTSFSKNLEIEVKTLEKHLTNNKIHLGELNYSNEIEFSIILYDYI